MGKLLRWFALVGALVGALALPAAATSTGSEVSFVTVAVGQTSGVRQPLQAVIRDRAAWTELWRRHAGPAATVPAVDFTQEMVLAVFAGAAPVPRAVSIGRIVRENGRLTIWYSVRERLPIPEPEGLPPTAPFHIVRLARSGLPVVFMQAKTFPPAGTP